ncbi:P-loop NTPase fold protein [Aeromonas veronii]|uniref:P-loop NTPase fold protein n=1 Tax=Aeromonas veronii TaxID=654 RepID=UPI001D09F4E5|nr:P-loop NTPase fold protein [Aeromonas veronii]UDN21271.1 KAP family NTPase [Aeromonas veronii]
MIKKLLNRMNKKNSEIDKKMKAYSGPDTALANYLQYYSSLKSPGYAVLITGPWGVGKTYQVKKIIPETDRYFVSLYGIDSVNGIHDAVLASCLPSLNASEHLSTLGDVGKAMGDKFALAGFANSVLNIFLRQRLKPDKIIIFDDLERSSLWHSSKKELLGAINHYVEHQGFRVIVICHDEKIEDQLAEFKEKTFGHTIKVEPQIDAALSAFLEDIQNNISRNFVSSKRDLIEEIWRQSKESSLRILRHVINDVARLHSTLSEKHLNNNDAIEHIIKFFCALDIEVRAGNLNRTSLVNRWNKYVSSVAKANGDNDGKSLFNIVSKYSSSDITGSILSDEIIISTLIDGMFKADVIREWLDQTSYFITASETPPWRIVIKFCDLDDTVLNEGIKLMQKQFDDRTVINPGEFLHIAALRLMMVEQGYYKHSMEEEQSLCIAYIDDLFATGKLTPKPLIHSFETELSSDSYDGYGYWVSSVTKKYFMEVFTHLSQTQQKALENLYPEYANDVLNKIREDPTSIIEYISQTASGNNLFAHVPILHFIPVNDFIDAWLGGPRSGWRKIKIALENRYEYGKLDKFLSEEKKWLVELEREMDSRIDAVTGLDAFRLKRVKPQILSTLE